jgi:uncharacterized protein (TIGR02246 family)
MTTSKTGRDADEKLIRELVARSQEAQLDADALPALHTPDLVLVNLAGRRVFGRDTFAAAMAEALSTPLKDVRTTLRIDDIRFPAADVAIASLTKTIHDERSAGAGTMPTTGAMTYVLVRRGDGWQIALAQTTPIR